MPYEVAGLRNAHTIGQNDIEAALRGKPSARAFIRVYGQSDRERWRKFVVPFVEDPFEGRSFFTGGGSVPDYVQRGHPRRGNGKLFAKYEKILEQCGLSANISGGDQQHVIVPKDSTPPLAYVKDAPLQLDRKYAIKDGARVVGINVHEREIPDWALSDEKIREYILHVCPQLEKSKRSRRRAALIVATAYLWFRTMLPAESIAEELGCSVQQVLNRVTHIRKHGAKLFSAAGCDCHSRQARNWHSSTHLAA